MLVRTGEEIIDLLRGGQGVFNVVPLAGVVGEVDAAILRIDAPGPAESPTAAARDAGAACASGPDPDRRGRLDAFRPAIPPVPEPPPHAAVRFAHDSERLFAELLDYYEVAGSTSRSSSCSPGDADGQPTCAFRPDFYLCEHDLFLELTTLRQELVTVKNRKLRQMAELYPEVHVRVLYRRDVLSLLGKVPARGNG